MGKTGWYNAPNTLEENMTFQLTYSTMFNPPQELHDNYEESLSAAKANLGQEYPMIIGGEDRYTEEKHQVFSPINTEWHLATFQKGSAQDAQDAISAAKQAFEPWAHTPWTTRVAMVRKWAARINERLFEIAAAMSLEVGKNRMEALGDVAETVALIEYSCDMMDQNGGFIHPMDNDPLEDFLSSNESVLRPYGVWLIISPFNFPGALVGGPAGAALVAGNTIIIKPASDTSWTSYLMSEAAREAGLPDGVVNFVTGKGSVVGDLLTNSEDIDGITFTGSYEVGMGIFRTMAAGAYVKPCILELGGKNPTLVSKNADIEDAAIGIVRSAFGLSGQKCSAASRVYVEAEVYEQVVERVLALTEKLKVGDPTHQDVFMGPVINRGAYENYAAYIQDLQASGRVRTGGKQLRDGDFAKGYYCAPTVVTDLAFEHRLWKEEMFLPITTIGKVESLEEGMRYANDSVYGLTAGFYGNEEEREWFLDRIQAGVVYTNRPQGSTTGAWPGFQPFGGWKGSGSSGKNGGGLYYVPLYMHEQIQNRVRRA